MHRRGGVPARALRAAGGGDECLEEAHTGDLGGVAAADGLCAQQAAQHQVPGAWKAFLSATGRDARDLVPVELRSLPVVTSGGEVLLAAWSDLGQTVLPTSTPYLQTFSGIRVDDGAVDPDWADADAWTGTQTDGTLAVGLTCNDWTGSANLTGVATELDIGGNMLTKQDINSCTRYGAVMCVASALASAG